MNQQLTKPLEDDPGTHLDKNRRHALTTDERRDINLAKKIHGWGSDIDLGSRPGVPRDKSPDIGPEMLYANVYQQVPKTKIHKSLEHPRLTPVFGTSCPPRGLSGLIRNYAFTFSEGKKRHFVLLMLADRVDVLEQLVLDIAHFHLPNPIKEMGLAAELKYRRRGVAKKSTLIGIGAGILTLTLFTVLRRSH